MRTFKNRTNNAIAFALTFFVITNWCAFESQAAPITVKDLKGRAMIVEVLQYAPATKKVKIQRTSDKQVFDVELKVFDAVSQAKMIEVAPPAVAELDIKVSTGKRRKRQADSSFMKNQEITNTIVITNESRDAGVKDGTLVILLVGRATARYANRDADGAMILSKQEISANIPADGEFKYECKPVVTEYDSDKDSTNLGGWEFDGYLLAVKNKAGEIIAISTNLAEVERHTLKQPGKLKAALELREGTRIPRNLQGSTSSPTVLR